MSEHFTQPRHGAAHAKWAAYIVLSMTVFATNALAAPPKKFNGARVEQKEFTVLGDTKIMLPVTKHGPIPASNDRVEFVGAGPLVKRSVSGQPPSYRWAFNLLFKKNAEPTAIAIDDVTGVSPHLLIDDQTTTLEPYEGDLMWSSQSASDCVVDKKSECSAWLNDPGTRWVVFRATVLYKDGSIDMLYQPAAFDAQTISVVFNAWNTER
jgi:hypothetical protein